MRSAETQSNNGIMALIATIALVYFSRRYPLLKPMRRGIPVLLLMCAWFINRSSSGDEFAETGTE